MPSRMPKVAASRIPIGKISDKGQMDAELGTGQQCVRVRAHGVERDEPEVQQPGVADHHVEAHGEQHVDQNVVGNAHVIEPRQGHEDEHQHAGGKQQPGKGAARRARQGPGQHDVGHQ